MISLVEVGDSANMPTNEYIVDTIEEMNSLDERQGTKVRCLEDSKFYVCNGLGQFVAVSMGGSGGGTSDYNDLTNLPKINDVELKGEKTLDDLGVQSKFVEVSKSITTADWTNNTATVSVSGVTATNLVQVSPAPASVETYAAAGIYCSAQSTNTLTFNAKTVPDVDLTVNVVVWN